MPAGAATPDTACADDPDPDPPPEPAGGSACARKAAERAGVFIRREGTGEDLIAARELRPAEVVFEFQNVTWRRSRDAFTVEHPSGRHFYDPLLARVSHSCDPNARVSTKLMALVARRPIAPGEIITFDYLSTETAIAAPFLCHCGAAQCRGWIAGPSPAATFPRN
jgi:hypothetical protein